jgi:hypothetical protein
VESAIKDCKQLSGVVCKPYKYRQHGTICYSLHMEHGVTDLINALPGNSSVNAVQQATIEEAVFSVDPIDVPIDWLDSDHMICVYCRSMSIPRLYK